jgi:DNA (cytosine-5)-methyltransferase 1
MTSFYEFFAGGGMARAGLGSGWTCLFANDFDAKKAAIYAANWGPEVLKIADVSGLRPSDLPGTADVAWASFPCQDLSLAGAGAGLKGERSGTFWPFWNLIEALKDEARGPRLVVLENVCGALTSHDGRDFAAIAFALVDCGYRFGALIIDAIRFLPQSRPRLFLIGAHSDCEVPSEFASSELSSLWHSRELGVSDLTSPWHTPSLMSAYRKLPLRARREWIWWRLPIPTRRRTVLADLIEDEPQGVAWHSETETQRLLQMMSDVNFRKVEEAKRAGRCMIGGVYRRTRSDGIGGRIQRAEIRFDDVAGCLRTPAGGSSRQSILFVEGSKVRSRLLSPREAARLMGLPDTYRLPDNYNEAYHLAGDGVAVPVVRFLAAHLLEPILSLRQRMPRKAA